MTSATIEFYGISGPQSDTFVNVLDLYEDRPGGWLIARYTEGGTDNWRRYRLDTVSTWTTSGEPED